MMRWIMRSCTAVLTLAAYTVVPAATPAPAATTAAVALLQDAGGKDTGAVAFAEEANGKVRVAVAATGLSPGFHGIHVHNVGKCEAPTFATAGTHFLADSQTHGSHAGDLPPLFATADGVGFALFTTDRFKVADLFDAD